VPFEGQPDTTAEWRLKTMSHKLANTDTDNLSLDGLCSGRKDKEHYKKYHLDEKEASSEANPLLINDL
jgi:hypothetical protein